MKEIEVLDEPSDLFDEELGYYKVTKEGSDDVVVVKNLKTKQIVINKALTLSGNNDYKIIEKTHHNIYIVQPLDNIDKVACLTNTTKEDLIKKNDLKTTKLFIGQKILY